MRTLIELNQLRRYFGTVDFIRFKAWRFYAAWNR